MILSVHKFTNEIYSYWQYITVQCRTDIKLFKSNFPGGWSLSKKGNTGDVEHLHDPAENPLEVVVTHLLAVPSEPASARERVTVSVKSNVAAGPDPAPHV